MNELEPALPFALFDVLENGIQIVVEAGSVSVSNSTHLFDNWIVHVYVRKEVPNLGSFEHHTLRILQFDRDLTQEIGDNIADVPNLHSPHPSSSNCNHPRYGIRPRTRRQMAKYHPDKEVSDAMEYAVGLGWTIVWGDNHTYARLLCPQGDRTGCHVPVFHTPKNPGNHARGVIRRVNACDCRYKYEGDDR